MEREKIEEYDEEIKDQKENENEKVEEENKIVGEKVSQREEKSNNSKQNIVNIIPSEKEYSEQNLVSEQSSENEIITADDQFDIDINFNEVNFEQFKKQETNQTESNQEQIISEQSVIQEVDQDKKKLINQNATIKEQSKESKIPRQKVNQNLLELDEYKIKKDSKTEKQNVKDQKENKQTSNAQRSQAKQQISEQDRQLQYQTLQKIQNNYLPENQIQKQGTQKLYQIPPINLNQRIEEDQLNQQLISERLSPFDQLERALSNPEKTRTGKQNPQFRSFSKNQERIISKNLQIPGQKQQRQSFNSQTNSSQGDKKQIVRKKSLLLRVGHNISNMFHLVSFYQTHQNKILLVTANNENFKKYSLLIEMESILNEQKLDQKLMEILEKLQIIENQLVLQELKSTQRKVIYKKPHYICKRYFRVTIYKDIEGLLIEALEPSSGVTLQCLIKHAIPPDRNNEEVQKELSTLIPKLHIDTIFGKEVLILTTK